MLHTVRMYPRNIPMVAIPSRELSPRRDGFRELLETNYQKRNLVHLTAGSVVPLLKNSIWLVVRGMVKLGALSVHGDELVLGLVGPNEPFGAAFTNVEAYEAIALTDCDLLCCNLAELEQSPQLALGLAKAMAARYRQAESLLALLGLRRVEERVRGFLELLAKDFGEPCDAGLRLNLRLTHQEIASALSTTRVTVTRVLGQLRDEGWLQIDASRHLVVTGTGRR